MDIDEDLILNDPREAVIQAKMMAEIQSILPQQPQPPQQEGPPSPNDPTGSGGGNIGPGNPQNEAQRASQSPVVATTQVNNLHRPNLAKEYEFNNYRDI